MPSDSAEAAGGNIRIRHGIPPDACVLGTVANLLPIKGLETMIEALPLVRTKMPSVRYIIVGAGSEAYLRELLNLCKDRDVSDAVHFVGFHDRPWAYLESMDLYVQPSRDEALGIAAIEAMAMGKPVVASRVGGLPEVVDHERTGLLVTPDDPEKLSDAILSLLQDDVRRKAMGELGAQVARERFDVRSSVTAIERLYLEVLNAGRSRE
jgi:glycosyltransferase involved in cell wall biosynthesis